MHIKKIRYGDSAKAAKRSPWRGFAEPRGCIGTRRTPLAMSMLYAQTDVSDVLLRSKTVTGESTLVEHYSTALSSIKQWYLVTGSQQRTVMIMHRFYSSHVRAVDR